MTQQKIELNPDIILKNYWQDNEHYADFINAVLFQGADMIKAEDLHDVDSNEAFMMEHRKVLQSIQMTRDVIKVCKRSKKHKVDFVLLGMEAQEHIHYAMPMRIMGYDYASYKKQYDANARQLQKGNWSDTG